MEGKPFSPPHPHPGFPSLRSLRFFPVWQRPGLQAGEDSCSRYHFLTAWEPQADYGVGKLLLPWGWHRAHP